MSSILKALKKLEDSKAARPPGSLHIDTDILRNDTPRRVSLPGIALASALLFVCGSGVTYVYMKPAGKPVSGQPSVAAVAAPPTPSLPQTTAPRPQGAPGAVTSSPARSPGQHATPRSAIRTAKTAAQRPAAVAVPRPAPSPGQAAPVVTVPTVKVNGIAFQGDGAGSVAVINGAPAAIGAVIDGAKVEDIQRDRVRFSYNGETFEVGLGKSNR
ncbi:MAG TPA: hypothetical protein VIH45_14030 [Desulfuromonadaceae bacterium]